MSCQMFIFKGNCVPSTAGSRMSPSREDQRLRAPWVLFYWVPQVRARLPAVQEGGASGPLPDVMAVGLFGSTAES